MSKISLPIIPTKKNSASSYMFKQPAQLLNQSISSINLTTKLYLRPSREISKRGSIEKYPGSIGPSAKLDFQSIYKSGFKINDRNSFQKLELSPSAGYLETIDKHKLRPIAFGIVKNSGKESEFDIHNMSVGDNYAQAISEGIRLNKSLEKINLKDNRLSEKGLAPILSKIETQKIKYLCLSENKINLNVVKQLTELFLTSQCALRHLILENTKITDASAIVLFQGLTRNSSVTRLVLARNSLTENSCGSLREMLFLNKNLKKLDLHWNTLKGPGVVLIFEGLKQNSGLQELDLSWNLMSRNLGEKEAKIVADSFRDIKFLKHLDLSSNYLSANICALLAEGLKTNSTILGIHMAGNDCRVDSRGFLHPDICANKVQQVHIKNRILIKKKHNNKNLNNCWVCEDWVENKFVWAGEANEPVCIHLECDDYQPDLMNKEGNHYSITRVVPSGKTRFFFSTNLVISKAKDLPVVKLPFPVEKEITFWNSAKANLFITYVNQIETSGKKYNLNDSFFNLPRAAKQVFVPPKTEYYKIKWTIGISIFKRYKIDTPELLAECFEFDFKHSRIPGMLKKETELQEVKNLLLSYYPDIREAYKTLSAYSGGDLPSIGTNTVTEFLTSCQVFGQDFAISDFGVNWNAATSQPIKNQLYNPGNALVRYEFLEFLVRVAHDKYIRSRSLTSLAEAIKCLMESHLLSYFKSLSSNTWRNECYRCETIDVTLKAHKLLFQGLYRTHSGKKTLPGQKNFMSLEEFREICTGSGLVSDLLAMREVDVCFYKSIMTQVDELYSKRHTEMHFLEFLEGMTRVCEMYAVKIDYDLPGHRRSMTLREKIETASHLLVKLCPAGIQETFEFPDEMAYNKFMYRAKGSIFRTTTLNLLDASFD